MTTATASVESTTTAADGTKTTEKRVFRREPGSPFASRQIREAKGPLALAGAALVAAGVGGTLLVQQYVLPRLVGLNDGV